mgnify:CR=1 FL=1
MKTVLLFHHLGLGDHIMFNGLVRSIAESSNVILMVWERYFKEVSFMFSDIDIKYCRLFIETQEEVDYKIKHTPHDEFIIVGKHNCVNGRKYTIEETGILRHDEYKSAGVDPSFMHTKFYIPRDIFMEDFVYKLFANKRYIIVHDDPSRNIKLDMSRIPEKEVEIFYIGQNRNNFTRHFNMFHMYKIMMNADAFHGYESSWSWLFELWKIPIKKYLHVYVRDDYINEVYYDKKYWTFLK